MNLTLVHKLLQAANDQPYGFLKVNGPALVREVELMAAAGLIESSETVNGLETYTVIKRITDSGYSFLRAFHNEPPIARERRISRSPTTGRTRPVFIPAL